MRDNDSKNLEELYEDANTSWAEQQKAKHERWKARGRQPQSDTITKYNLEIHQLLNHENLQTMYDYLEEVEQKLYPGDRDSFTAIQQVKRFLQQLERESGKIKHAVNAIEDTLEVGMGGKKIDVNQD